MKSKMKDEEEMKDEEVEEMMKGRMKNEKVEEMKGRMKDEKEMKG